MAPKGAGWKELVMFRIRLRAKDTTPLEPSPREKFSAVFRGHPLPKSKFVFAFTIMRLICTFHEELLSKKCACKKPTNDSLFLANLSSPFPNSHFTNLL